MASQVVLLASSDSKCKPAWLFNEQSQPRHEIGDSECQHYVQVHVHLGDTEPDVGLAAEFICCHSTLELLFAPCVIRHETLCTQHGRHSNVITSDRGLCMHGLAILKHHLRSAAACCCSMASRSTSALGSCCAVAGEGGACASEVLW